MVIARIKKVIVEGPGGGQASPIIMIDNIVQRIIYSVHKVFWKPSYN
jgi:hypothetical protein